MAKRRERVAPPPVPGGWDFRYATSDAVKGWAQISAAAPGNARVAWESITADPRDRSKRQHPLKDDLAQRVVNGTELEQWQYEEQVRYFTSRVKNNPKKMERLFGRDVGGGQASVHL